VTTLGLRGENKKRASGKRDARMQGLAPHEIEMLGDKRYGYQNVTKLDSMLTFSPDPILFIQCDCRAVASTIVIFWLITLHLHRARRDRLGSCNLSFMIVL